MPVSYTKLYTDMVLSGKFPIWEILKTLEYFPFAEDIPFRKNNLKAPLVFDL